MNFLPYIILTAISLVGGYFGATALTEDNLAGGDGTITQLVVRTFLGLTDTPNSYSGQGGKVVAVNAGATALEFITVTGGSGGGNSKWATSTDTRYIQPNNAAGGFQATLGTTTSATSTTQHISGNLTLGTPTTTSDGITVNDGKRASFFSDDLWTYAGGHEGDRLRFYNLTDTAKSAITWYDATTTTAVAVGAIVGHDLLTAGNEHKHISIEVVGDDYQSLNSVFECRYGETYGTDDAYCGTASQHSLRVGSGGNFYVVDGDVRHGSTLDLMPNYALGNSTVYARFATTSTNGLYLGGGGTNDIVLDDTVTVTGNLNASGTTMWLDSSGTASIINDRGATTNFGSNIWRTAGTDQWTLGTRNDSTNNMYFRDNINGVNVMTLYQGATAGLNITASTSISGNLNITGNATATQATTTHLAVSNTASTSMLSVNGLAWLNNNSLRLRGETDGNHELKYDATVDGPILKGFAGFALQDTNGNLFTGNGTELDALKQLNLNSNDILNIRNATSAIMAFTTRASTTQLYVSDLKSCDTIDTDANGLLSCGTDAQGGGGGAGNSKWATSTDNVSLAPNGGGGIIVSASSTIVGSLNITGNATATNATTTNLRVSGNASTTNLYLSLGACDTLDTDSTGKVICGTDAQGAGGGAGNSKWATSTVNNLDIYPNGITNSGVFGRAGQFTGANALLSVYATSTMADGGSLIYASSSPDFGANFLRFFDSGSGADVFVIGSDGSISLTGGDNLISGGQNFDFNSYGSGGALRINEDSSNPFQVYSAAEFFGNATLTNATTTNLFSTTASSTNLFASVFTFGSNILSLLSNTITAGAAAIIDFGSALSFEIPNGSAPAVDAIGEIAFDTTDNQLLIATSTNASYPAVYPAYHKLWGATIASTSPDFVSGGRIWLPPLRDGFTVKEFHCAVDAGTSVVFNLSNSGGTTDSETITCDADGATDTNVTSNNTYAAGSLNSIEFGTVTGSVDYLTFAIYGVYTRE